MSDFIARLVQRQWGQIPTIQPRLPSMFAPVTEQSEFHVADVPNTQEPFSAQRRGPAVEMERPELQNASGPVGSLLTPHMRLVGAPHAKSQYRVDKPAQQTETLWSRQQTRQVSLQTQPALPASEAVVPLPHNKALRTGPSTAGASFKPESMEHLPRLVESWSEHSRNMPPSMLAPMSLPVSSVSPASAQRSMSQVAEPPVQVTIGRIEVTALTQAAPAKRAAAPRKPGMSLDDYLARRRRREP
jgi:hypothetical protein